MSDEKRRKKGDGTFAKSANGKVTFRVQYGFTDDGKRLRKTFTGKSEAECRRKAKEFEKGLYTQKNTLQELTLGAWMNEWLESYVKPRVQPATYTTHLYNFKIIADDPVLPKKLLTDIKPLDISKFYGRTAHYSKSVLGKLRFLLRGAFEAAIDNDLCYKNPAKYVNPPKKEIPEKVVFTDQEVKTILAFAERDSRFGLAIMLLFETGMRSGEVRALCPTDINLLDREITISKAIKRDQSLGRTKTGKTRIVPISPRLAAYLANYVLVGNYVIGGQTYLKKEQFEREYKHFFERLNIDCREKRIPEVAYHSPHTTRHTYASMLVKAGVNLKIVQMILGHADIQMTGQYSHAELSDLKKAVNSTWF